MFRGKNKHRNLTKFGFIV